MPRVLIPCLLLLMACTAVHAAEFVTTPVDNHGEPWRIGYYQGGPYFNYQRNLRAFLQGLMELGWIEPAELPEEPDPNNSKSLWDFACDNLGSKYVRFEKQAFWSADWDEDLRRATRDDCIRRLQNREVDFMLAAGTWAGEDLANDLHSVPMTVFAVSDPVRSGIVESAGEAGLDHVHAKCDPDRYVRMTRLFYNLFSFKRLGITYENSEEGLAHAAVKEIEQVSREFGFEVVRCEAPFSNVTFEQAAQRMIDCQKRLAQTVDAVIIPVHRGVTPQHMSQILAPYFEHSVPTFSQQGSLEVKHGVLMGITLGPAAFRQIGLFHAKTATSAFNGVIVGDLPLIFEDPRSMALNLETARRIGYEIPPGLLLVAEEIFETIAPDVIP